MIWNAMIMMKVTKHQFFQVSTQTPTLGLGAACWDNNPNNQHNFYISSWWQTMAKNFGKKLNILTKLKPMIGIHLLYLYLLKMPNFVLVNHNRHICTCRLLSFNILVVHFYLSFRMSLWVMFVHMIWKYETVQYPTNKGPSGSLCPSTSHDAIFLCSWDLEIW